MAEAYDEMTEMITHVDHANVTTFTMWMEDWLQMDRNAIKIVSYDEECKQCKEITEDLF